MTNYQCGQLSRTLGTVVLSGMLASQALASAYEAPGPNLPAKLYRPYRSGATAHTYDQYANVITGEYSAPAPTVDLETTVSQIYARLLSSQEPLGGEFEEVLQDSLWDLYEA